MRAGRSARAVRPGEELVRARPRLLSPESPATCVSPGCEEGPEPGGRFCARHAEQLARVRAELGEAVAQTQRESAQREAEVTERLRQRVEDESRAAAERARREALGER
jgi:hypothetical protein